MMRPWLGSLILAVVATFPALAQTVTWRGTLLHEHAEECLNLPSFDRLLASYYTALRADRADQINLQALRDFSALAIRHGAAAKARSTSPVAPAPTR